MKVIDHIRAINKSIREIGGSDKAKCLDTAACRRLGEINTYDIEKIYDYLDSEYGGADRR